LPLLLKIKLKSIETNCYGELSLLSEVKYVPSLTIKENLYLPLVFAAIEKDMRDEIIGEALAEHDLKAIANKFHRYLTEEEREKVSTLKLNLWKRYPEYNIFLNVLKEKKGLDLVLPLIQYEVFTNIAKNLKIASERISREEFDDAVKAIEKAIERLALRVSLGHFYVLPSLRAMEISILVIRNYRDILKHKEKVEGKFLEIEKGQAISHLKHLADSFIEMRSIG